jgi:hypothetical protein
MESELGFDLAQYKLEVVEGCGDVYKMAMKWNIIPPSTIIAFFGFHKPSHKNDPKPRKIFEDHILMITKGYMFLFVIGNHFIHCLMMHCDCKCVFPSRKQLMSDHLPITFTKTLQKCVLPTLTKCARTTCFYQFMDV